MKECVKKQQNIFWYGPVLIAIAAALWALDGITRRSLYHLLPIIIVFYEHLIGALLLAPFVPQILKKEKLTMKVLLIGGTVALLGGLLGTLWITTALTKVNFISFSVVFLIQKLQPLFTISSAALLLGEKVSRGYLKWAVLALVAVFFVTFPNGLVNFGTGNGTIIAALYSLGAAAAWGIGTTLSKLLLNHVSEKAGIVLRYYGATVLAFLSIFLLGAGGQILSVGGSEIARLVFIAFTTGLAAMWLYYTGLKVTQAKVSTIMELTFPLLAVFVDMFLYKTFLTPSQYVAAGVLLFAMYRVSKIQTQGKVVAKK